MYCPPWLAPGLGKASHRSPGTRQQPAPARPPSTPGCSLPRAAGRQDEQGPPRTPRLSTPRADRAHCNPPAPGSYPTNNSLELFLLFCRFEVLSPKIHAQDVWTPPPPSLQGADRPLHRQATLSGGTAPPGALAVPAAPHSRRCRQLGLPAPPRRLHPRPATRRPHKNLPRLDPNPAPAARKRLPGSPHTGRKGLSRPRRCSPPAQRRDALPSPASAAEAAGPGAGSSPRL